MLKVSAIALAGGKSKRLGMDKSLLKIDHEWLLQRILSALAALSDDVFVVANDQEKLAHLAVQVVPDIRPEMGPLGGIYAGLHSMRHERGVFVACDMPFLNLELLRYMILLSADFDVVIPRVGDNVEPLHAVYSKACVQPIADLLDQRGRRVVGFFHQVRVRYVEQQEIEAFDPQHLSFFNINTVQDLDRMRNLLRRKARPRSRDRHSSGP